MSTGQAGRGGGGRRTPPGGPALAAAVALAVNLTLFAAAAAHAPGYLADFRSNPNPDARDYVVLGRNLLLHGRYSRSPDPPYPPDVLRTPVYPVFAGALELAGGAGAVYLAQGLLQAGSCLLLYRVVRPVLGAAAAFWASLVMATDLMAALSNFEAMSEPLFVFLTLAACAAAPPGADPAPPRRLLAGGLLLGLATLTRPVALYLAPLLAAAHLAAALRRPGRRPAALAGVAAFLAGSLAPAGLWAARNQAVFSVPRLTTVDTQNLVYFFGAGGYQVRHGLSLEAAQARIASEFAIPPYVVLQNPWIGDAGVAEMDARVRAVRGGVLRKYPKELAVASLKGLAKAALSHNAGQAATLLGRAWDPPGAGGLLRGDRKAWTRLGGNGAVPVSAFLWESAHAALTLAAAAAGLAAAFRHPRGRPGLWALAAVLVYFEATVTLFGLEAYCRCRLPALPWLDAFAGAGIAGLVGGARAGRRGVASPGGRRGPAAATAPGGAEGSP